MRKKRLKRKWLRAEIDGGQEILPGKVKRTLLNVKLTHMTYIPSCHIQELLLLMLSNMTFRNDFFLLLWYLL